jgi:hypothetical protein
VEDRTQVPKCGTTNRMFLPKQRRPPSHMSFPITIEREVGGWEHEEVQDRTPSVARESGGAAPLVTRESGGAATSTTRDSSQTFDCRERERNSARLHARIGARFGPPHHLIVVTSPRPLPPQRHPPPPDTGSAAALPPSVAGSPLGETEPLSIHQRDCQISVLEGLDGKGPPL